MFYQKIARKSPKLLKAFIKKTKQVRLLAGAKSSCYQVRDKKRNGRISPGYFPGIKNILPGIVLGVRILHDGSVLKYEAQS